VPAVGSPVASTLYPTRLLLPTLNKTGEKVVFESPTYVNVPKKIEPVPETDEKNIIELLVQELNGQFMTDLALEFCTDRELAEQDDAHNVLDDKRFVLVGASHTARLACAFEDMDLNVVDLSVPGWRATSASVTSMCTQLSKVLNEDFDGETIVIYQLFDNSCYLACDAEGNRSLPVKGKDQLYHVPGRLVMADRDEFREMFTEALPLLRAGQDCVKVLLTPLMRYIVKPCCADPTHIINKGAEQPLGLALGESLNLIYDWLRGLAFTRRIRNFTVIDPNEVIQTKDNVLKAAKQVKKFWKADPVHMSEEGYRVLGKNMLERILEADLSRRTDKEDGQSTGGRKMVDWAERRSAWVSKNDSQVHRRYDMEAGPSGFRGGQRGGRGGWAGRARGHYKTRGGQRGNRGGYGSRPRPY
jgi:hypothetical protein